MHQTPSLSFLVVRQGKGMAIQFDLKNRDYLGTAAAEKYYPATHIQNMTKGTSLSRLTMKKPFMNIEIGTGSYWQNAHKIKFQSKIRFNIL